MFTDSHPQKRGPKPRGYVDLKVAVPPELHAMLHQIALSTGISKATLIRDALARYGEALGFLPEGTAASLTPTRTRRLGSVPANRKE
jgi:hypothetical protein